MFTTSDRQRIPLRRLADHPGYASAQRKLWTKICAALKTAGRLGIILVALAFAAVVALIVQQLPGNTSTRRLRGARIMRALSRKLLAILNVRCQFENLSELPLDGDTPLLFLPNHISYIDALLMCAHVPAVFVTSREVEESAFLGALTKAVGCIFVERRHRGDVLRDIDQISSILNQGVNVTLFPEGSTSPGDKLLEFKKTLLEAAIRSRCRVLPVTIEYLAIDEARYDETNRDDVAWYGDMTFFPHLLRFAGRRSIDVRLTILKPTPYREHGCRKQLAADVRQLIAEQLFGTI